MPYILTKLLTRKSFFFSHFGKQRNEAGWLDAWQARHVIYIG
jgi:hypothetical protein